MPYHQPRKGMWCFTSELQTAQTGPWLQAQARRQNHLVAGGITGFGWADSLSPSTAGSSAKVLNWILSPSTARSQSLKQFATAWSMIPVSHHSADGEEEEARQPPYNEHSSKQHSTVAALSLHQDQTRDIIEPATNLQAA